MRRHIVFEIIIAEIGRALAAARRYESLKYGRAQHEDLAAADIPRRIFEEFYAFPKGLGTGCDSSELFPRTNPICTAPPAADLQHASQGAMTMAIVNKTASRIAAMFVSMAFIGGMQLASVPPAAALDGLVRTDSIWGSRSMDSPKGANAGCPWGKVVVGGGAEIEGGGENEATQPRLTWLFPVSGFGFYAQAETPRHAPAQEPWTLRVYAICADAKDLGGYQIVFSEGSGHDSQPFKKGVARCPDGTVAYGAGGLITYLHGGGKSQGGVGLQLVRTSGPLDIARATAREYPGGHPGAWDVAAIAICAAPAGGIHAENTGGGGEKATHRCSSDRSVHGAGGGGGLDDGGPVHLQFIIPNEELTHVFVRLTGKLKPAIGGMVASATCAE